MMTLKKDTGILSPPPLSLINKKKIIPQLSKTLNIASIICFLLIRNLNIENQNNKCIDLTQANKKTCLTLTPTPANLKNENENEN